MIEEEQLMKQLKADNQWCSDQIERSKEWHRVLEAIAATAPETPLTTAIKITNNIINHHGGDLCDN